MKQYILRHENHDGTIKKSDDPNRDGYFIIKNSNEELRQKWINFFSDKSSITSYYEWKIVEWEFLEVRCEHKRDVKYFDRKIIESYIDKELSSSKRKSFNAFEEFSKQYPFLSLYQNNNGYEYEMYSIINLNNKENIENNHGNYLINETYTFNKNRSNDISINYRLDRNTLDIQFSDDGNFKVRSQYNIHVDMYESKKMDPSTLLDKLYDEIFKLGTTFEYANGKYYTPEFCYIPFSNLTENYYGDTYGVHVVPLRYDWNWTYASHNVKAFKKPKRLETKTINDLAQDVKNLVSIKLEENFKKYKD